MEEIHCCRDSCAVRGHATSQFGTTVLVQAASCGHVDTVELLLDRGADLEAKSRVCRAKPLLWGGPH